MEGYDMIEEEFDEEVIMLKACLLYTSDAADD